MKQLLLLCLIFTSFLSFSQVSLVRDINISGSSNPESLFIVPVSVSGGSDEQLFFSADNGQNFGVELFNSIPCCGGSYITAQLTDINPGTGSSNPEDFIVSNNTLYFTANHISFGKEIWSWPTTQLFKRHTAGVSKFYAFKLYCF